MGWATGSSAWISRTFGSWTWRAHAMVDAARALGDDGCLIIHGAQPLLTKMFEILDVSERSSNLHILDGHRSP